MTTTDASEVEDVDHLRRPITARPSAVRPARHVGLMAPRRHLAWLTGATMASFLVPFVFADRLGLQRDLYYGIYVAFVGGLFAAWLRDTRQPLREMVRRRPWLAAGLTFACAGLAVVLVYKAEHASPHPGGMTFLGAFVWRGLVYGAADGLLLTTFPILVVFAALAGSRLRRRRGGRAAVAAVALAASLLMTATYHLGYSDFRSSKVTKPMLGDLVWSPSVLATANPVGAPIVHMAMHATAVAHSYDTDIFLPPH
jgi:hypothetical protein